MSERDRDDEVTAELERLGKARAAVEPLPGFTSRMLSGARRERLRRRRTRIGGVSLAGAAVAAAGALWLTHGDPQQRPAGAPPPVGGGEPVAVVDADDGRTMTALLDLTDVDQAMAPTADWDSITDPIAPAAQLLEEEP